MASDQTVTEAQVDAACDAYYSANHWRIGGSVERQCRKGMRAALIAAAMVAARDASRAAKALTARDALVLAIPEAGFGNERAGVAIKNLAQVGWKLVPYHNYPYHNYPSPGPSGYSPDEFADAATEANLTARAEKAEAERDAYKHACKSAGICMSCVLQAPESCGCADCLNTGWDGGDPREQIKVAEAERDASRASADALAGALREIRVAPDQLVFKSYRDRASDALTAYEAAGQPGEASAPDVATILDRVTALCISARAAQPELFAPRDNAIIDEAVWVVAANASASATVARIRPETRDRGPLVTIAQLQAERASRTATAAIRSGAGESEGGERP